MATIDLGYRPLAPYTDFHRSLAYERALYGGFGSGKTVATCAEAITHGLEQPGIRILMTRKTAPELRDTLEPVFMEVLPRELYQASEERRSGGHIESITLPTGTKFLFRAIDDWRKHKSLNLGGIYWDEMNEFDEETYLGMLGRLRQREPTAEAAALGAGPITRRCSVGATNPNGRDWVHRRFVNPEHKAAGSAYWEATSLDNPFLPEAYVLSLLDYPEPWVRRYVLCQHDDFAGQIYEEWGEQHVVSEVSEGEVLWMGMDPGTRNPTAGLWVVVDRAKKRLVAVAEYQQSGLALDAHVERWRVLERELKRPVRWRVADPSIMVRDRGSSMSLHSQAARLGFHFDLGPSKHKDRIPMLGKLVHLHQFVTTKDCPVFYEQMKNYRWEDLSPTRRAKGEDAPETPVQGDDHEVDCAQYLSSRWVVPPKVEEPAEDLTPWEEFSRDAAAEARKQIRRGTLPLAHDLGHAPV